MNTHNLLVALAIFYQGDWEQIYRALTDKRYPDDSTIDSLLSKMNSKALTILDSDYPNYLKRQYRPPFVLFYYGDISLLKDYKKNLGVVGSREPTEEGLKITKDLVKDVAKDYVIVSGLARGIDKAAHVGAIEGKGKTIAVLGNGIDYCYLSECKEIYEEIKENHLVISEYPGDTPPDAFRFPIRNRIISQITKALLVTESKIPSGTMITVAYSINMNKDIMCVPSRDLNNSGCNALLKEGAALVENGIDIANIMEEKFIIGS